MSHVYQELEKISADQPAGQDFRYEPEYDELQAEIDKMSLPSSEGGVNWAKVKSLSSDILSKKSKDLLVASYFVVAKAMTEKQSGLADGLHIYGGLLEMYWDTLFPAKKRMRGRIAAVMWLLEKCESAFDERELGSVSEEVKNSFQEGLKRLDTSFEAYLDDYSKPNTIRSFNKLNWVIEKSIVTGNTESQTNPVPNSESSESTDPVEEPEGSGPATPEEVSRPGGSQEPPAELPSQIITAEKDPVEPPTAAREEPQAAVNTTAKQASDSEIEKNLRSAFLTVRHAGDIYFNENLFNPLSYRLRRVAGWSMIQNLPPARDGKTEVPPPGEFSEIKKRLEELRAAGSWQELLSISENRFNGALLWLDLHRFSAESLSNLGSKYQGALDAVCGETIAMMARLPGLEKLVYADGSPFADDETKEWLKGLQGGSDTAIQPVTLSETVAEDSSRDILEQAQQLASSKKVSEAVSLLGRELQYSRGGRESMVWRLGLAQILLQGRLVKLAIPHLDEIVKDIDEYRLENWDPAFAVNALKVVWSGYRQHKPRRDSGDAILTRIAKLDPLSAMNMEKK